MQVIQDIHIFFFFLRIKGFLSWQDPGWLLTIDPIYLLFTGLPILFCLDRVCVHPAKQTHYEAERCFVSKSI